MTRDEMTSDMTYRDAPLRLLDPLSIQSWPMDKG